MTGDAPQPGETPRDEGSPWSFADPASPWWRADGQESAADRPGSRRTPDAATAAATPTLDPPRAAQRSGAAAEAHEAGAQDVLAALTGEPPQGATGVFTVPDHPPEAASAKSKTTEQEPPVRGVATPRHAELQPVEPQPAAHKQQARATESDHDQVDAERFNTEGDDTVYAARDRVGPATVPEREPTIVDLLSAVPAEAPSTGPDPEVMILPEPERNRPTVALERSSVPGQPATGLSRLGRARADRARADRALQDRVRQERTAALLETSPFWKAEEERRAQASWRPPETREQLANAGRPPRRRRRAPRRPVTGLIALVALGLIAAFFAWVSAEPFWLAVGHGEPGTATVERCTGSGVTQRCAGRFVAADGTYRVDGLALFGVHPDQRVAEATTPARMVSSGSRQAYVGSAGVLVHLRWALSFALVLICGLGIAGLTGARRLDTARARRGALVVSMAGPLALLAGFLFVTY